MILTGLALPDEDDDIIASRGLFLTREGGVALLKPRVPECDARHSRQAAAVRRIVTSGVGGRTVVLCVLQSFSSLDNAPAFFLRGV